MNKAEVKQLGVLAGEALDKAVNERFGSQVKCKTFFDFFGTMSYVTRHESEGTLKERIDDFIAGWVAGNQELAARLQNPDKFLN